MREQSRCGLLNSYERSERRTESGHKATRVGSSGFARWRPLNGPPDRYNYPIICPRCEKGEIAATTIRCNGAGLFVCEECEATWFVASEIGMKPFVDLGSHLQSLGLAPTWDELDAQVF